MCSGGLILPGTQCTAVHGSSAAPLQPGSDVFSLCFSSLLPLLQQAFPPVKQSPSTRRIKTGRMKRHHAAGLCGEDAQFCSVQLSSAQFRMIRVSKPGQTFVFTFSYTTASFSPPVSSLVDTHIDVLNLRMWRLVEQLPFTGIFKMTRYTQVHLQMCFMTQ